jgi:preprotein translocase subunit SecY
MHRELWRRIAFTLGALFVARLGAAIPLPGLSTDILHTRGVARVSILALSITPYVAATVLMQIVSLLSRRLRVLREDGERGRHVFERWTRLVAIAFAALSALGIASTLSGVEGVVTLPRSLFIASTVATLTAGMLFLVWLAEQITARGIGNGIALLFLARIVSDWTIDAEILAQLVRTGETTGTAVARLALLVAAATAAIVTVELARRRVPIAFSEREVGGRKLPAQTVDLALKLNPGGLMPAIILDWFEQLAALQSGSALATAGAVVFVIVATLVYAAFLFDPDRMAESLHRHGGALPGIAPGEATAAELDRIISRVAIVGAVYLALVLLLARLQHFHPGLPVELDGMALLVGVCVTIDVRDQIRALCVRTDAPPR